MSWYWNLFWEFVLLFGLAGLFYLYQKRKIIRHYMDIRRNLLVQLYELMEAEGFTPSPSSKEELEKMKFDGKAFLSPNAYQLLQDNSKVAEFLEEHEDYFVHPLYK